MVRSGIILAGLLAPAEPAFAQCFMEHRARITTAEPRDLAGFGFSAATTDEYAVLGTPFRDVGNEVRAGAVSVIDLRPGQGLREQLLIASDAAAANELGISVDLDGAWLVAGAHRSNRVARNAGAAHVFRLDGSGAWTEHSILVASDAEEGDRFGQAVAVSGDRIAVSVWWDDDRGRDAGAVLTYRYDGTTWAEEAKIAPADLRAADRFGNALDLEGDVMVVGAWNRGASGEARVFRFENGTWNEEAQLQPPHGQHRAGFGFDVSVCNGWVAVGEPFRDVQSHEDAGAVHVFRHDASHAWSHTQRLLAHRLEDRSEFGQAVECSSRYLAVGAPGDEEGHVSLFFRDGDHWSDSPPIDAVGARPADSVGASVAVSGEIVLAGAWRADDVGSNSGAAHLFETSCDHCDGVTDVQELIPSDSHDVQNLGSAVAVQGNWALLGASYDQLAGELSGAAYVYERGESGWSSSQRLESSTPNSAGHFGAAVALDAPLLAVSAPGDRRDGRSGRGAVFIHARTGNGWSELDKIVSSDGEAGDGFGLQIALDGSTLAVAAHADDDQGVRAGAVYLYEGVNGTWSESKLQASDGTAEKSFGGSLDVSGDVLVVGAPGDGDRGPHAGATYSFRRQAGGVWLEEQKLYPRDNQGRFGRQVAVCGTRLAVIAGGSMIALELFERDASGAWIADGPVFSYADSGIHGERDLDLASTTVVLGLERMPRFSPFPGTAVVLRRTDAGWTEDAFLRARDQFQDRFGYSVATDGTTTLVGANQAYEKGVFSGSVYVFENTIDLDVEPAVARSGDPFRATICHGRPGSLAVFSAVEIDGSAVDLNLAIGTVDPDGRFPVHATVPPGLTGSRIAFRGLGLNSKGEAKFTDVRTVDFR